MPKYLDAQKPYGVSAFPGTQGTTARRPVSRWFGSLPNTKRAEIGRRETVHGAHAYGETDAPALCDSCRESPCVTSLAQVDP